MSNIIDINPFLQHMKAKRDPAHSVHVLPDIPFVYSDFMEYGDELGSEIQYLIEGGYIPEHMLQDMRGVLSALAVARASVTAHVNAVLPPEGA